MRSCTAVLLLTLSLLSQLSAGVAPDILVLRQGVTVANGATDTVYGGVTGSVLSVSYVIANVGTAPLNLTGPVAITAQSSGLTTTLTATPDAVIAVGTTTSFSVDLLPSTAGAWSFTLTVPNDAAARSWTVSGTSSATLAPEIAVSRGGVDIAASATDTVTGTGLLIYEDLSYVVRNIGNAPLLISGADHGSTASCPLSVITSPAGAVAPGGSTTLTVRIQPLSNPWSTFVRFYSNDSDEGTYLINLAGTSATTGTTPEIEIAHGGSTVLGGTVFALAGGTANSESAYFGLTITNRGTPNLTGVAVTFPRSINCTPRLSLVPAATIPFSFTATAEVAVTPATNAAWQCDVAIASNDPNENPTVITLSGTATSGGGGGSGGDAGGGGGGCGAGAAGGLIIALSILGLRRRRR